MKRVMLILCLTLLLNLTKTYAFPLIEKVEPEPENVLCVSDECDSLLIKVNCSDTEGRNVTVFGSMTYPVAWDKNKTFVFEDGIWTYEIKPFSFFTIPSLYNFSVFCKNELNETNSTFKTFNVSKLEASITYFKSPVYLDPSEFSEIRVLVKKDGKPLDNYLTFNLKLSGSTWEKVSFPLESLWVIRFDLPRTKGFYELLLEAVVNIPSYPEKKIVFKKDLEVREPLELKLLSINKREVMPNDVLKISLSASEKDETIILSKDYFEFKVGSVTIDKDKVSLTASGDHFDFEFPLPELSPGNYELEIDFNYKNYSKTIRESISYVIPISGKFLDLNNKGIKVTIIFLVDGTEKKRISTDSSGYYSGYIAPGTYDIEFDFPQSKLFLYGVDLESFEDPVRYYFLSMDIEGIRSAGLFVFETSLPYSSAKLEMNYDESKIINEKNLVVFKCSDWNMGKKLCNSGWTQVSADIDTVKNVVTLETSSLSAYVVGERKSLNLQLTLEKEVYAPGELVKLRGVVRDEEKKLVSNALISISMPGMNETTYSDSAGIFSIEFLAPSIEGVYQILVEAKKNTYLASNANLTFKVVKKRELSLVLPDVIKIPQGDERIVEFSLINTGQVDLSNISISISGIPEEYFEIPEQISLIKVGEEFKIPVKFRIPPNATPTTLSLTFSAKYDSIEKKQTIGFTVLSTNFTTISQTQEESAFQFPSISFPTASLVLPFSASELTYVLIFGFLLIFSAYLLKKIKVRKKREREEIVNLLFDIKKEIKRGKIEHPMQAFNFLVERERK